MNKKRGKYDIISNETRKKIILSIDEGFMSPKTASDAFGIKIRTIYNFISSYNKEGRLTKKERVSNRKKVFNEDEIQQILRWVDKDCTITLKEIQRKIFEKYEFTPSISSIHKYLKEFHYTLKRIKKNPEVTYSEDLIEERRIYSLDIFKKIDKSIFYSLLSF